MQAAKAAPDPVARVAEKAVGEGSPGEPAEVPAPDPLGPKTEAQPPPKQIAEAAKKVALFVERSQIKQL